MSDTLVFNTEKNTVVQKFTIYDLIPEDDDRLSQIMPTFDFTNPPIEPAKLASNMVETCKKYNGLGLSAIQCGLPYRMFVMGWDQEYVAMFNPIILSYSKETIHVAEGCLSFPGLFLNITRPKTIKVEYTDYLGSRHQTDLTGLSARVFLHEYAHQDGLLFTDYCKPLALKRGLAKRDKKKIGMSMDLVKKFLTDQ